METEWKHLIYGTDYLPTKEENFSIKRSSCKTFSPSSQSFTIDNKQFNDVSSRTQRRFRYEFEKCNIASSQSEFSADGNIFDPQSSATSTSTLHSVNKNQPLASSTVDVHSLFPKNLQDGESEEIHFTKSMRSDGLNGMNTSCKDRMENSSHPPILQSIDTHRASTLHPKQTTNGNTEEYHRATSLKKSGSGTYLLNSNGCLKVEDDDGDDDVKVTTGVEESMSFASQSSKSTEFDSLKCCSSGYEVLRIQHFKVELKELKKEMQKVKLDNDALLKENQSLKEQLKRFHDKSITTSKGEILERSQNSTVTSMEFQAEKSSLSDERDKNDVDEDKQTKMNTHLLTKRRFSICSSTTENILQEAECFVRSSNQERRPTIVGQQTKRDSSLSSSSTLNSHSEIESAYFKEPAFKCDVELGDVVRFVSREGRIEQGKTMFIGTLPGKDFIYAGLELESEVGKHDGLYKGRRFFQCKRNRGIFVAVNKIVSIPSKGLPKQGAKF